MPLVRFMRPSNTPIKEIRAGLDLWAFWHDGTPRRFVPSSEVAGSLGMTCDSPTFVKRKAVGSLYATSPLGIVKPAGEAQYRLLSASTTFNKATVGPIYQQLSRLSTTAKSKMVRSMELNIDIPTSTVSKLKAAGVLTANRKMSTCNLHDKLKSAYPKVYQLFQKRSSMWKLSPDYIKNWKSHAVCILNKIASELKECARKLFNAVRAMMHYIGSRIWIGYKARVADAYFLAFLLGVSYALMVVTEKLEGVIIKEGEESETGESGRKKTVFLIAVCQHLIMQLRELRLLVLQFIRTELQLRQAIDLLRSLNAELEVLESRVDDIEECVASGEQTSGELEGMLKALQDEVACVKQDLAGVIRAMQEKKSA